MHRFAVIPLGFRLHVVLRINRDCALLHFLDELSQIAEAVLPKQEDIPVFLHLFQVCGAENPAQDGAGNDLRAAELVVPVSCLSASVVNKTLVGVDCRVRDLAFDRHDPPVFQPRHHVGARSGEPGLAAVPAGLRSGGEHGDGLCFHFLHAGARQDCSDGFLLRVFRCVAPPCTHIARRRERRRCDHSALAFVARRFAALCNPREPMRIDDCKHRIANASRARSIGTQTRRRKRHVRNRLEIVAGNRRRSQIAKGLLRVPTSQNGRNQLRIGRLRGNSGELVDEIAENTRKCNEEPIVEVEGFKQALAAKDRLRGGRVCLQLRAGPTFREKIRVR